MVDKLEAFSYFDKCWKHLHFRKWSNSVYLRNPLTISHKVQSYLTKQTTLFLSFFLSQKSYAALSLTARLCGNRNASQVYMNQARTLSGQIYDNPEADSGISSASSLTRFFSPYFFYFVVRGLLLMSFSCNLAYDFTRAQYYASVSNTLAGLVMFFYFPYYFFFLLLLTLYSPQPRYQRTGLGTNCLYVVKWCLLRLILFPPLSKNVRYAIKRKHSKGKEKEKKNMELCLFWSFAEFWSNNKICTRGTNYRKR